MVFDRCFLVGKGRVPAPRGATAQDGEGGEGMCVTHFRSWTSGKSHHVHVNLVIIDAVEAVFVRNDRRGVCLQQVLRHRPHVGRARAVGKLSANRLSGLPFRSQSLGLQEI